MGEIEITIIVFVAIIFFIAIFTGLIQAGNTYVFKNNAGKLTLGMTLEEVTEIMGYPADDIVEEHKKYKWRRKPYMHSFSHDKTISVTVIFENGKSVGIDRSF